MAFPISMFNIAYLAAGFKSQTLLFHNAIVKDVACCPLIFLSGVLMNIYYPNKAEPLNNEIRALKIRFEM